MLRILIVLLLMLLPATAPAADTPGHEGQTLVELNGRITWLDQDQIEGIKSWYIELKCFKGDTVLEEGTTGISVVDGYTGFAQGSSGTFSRNPYTGYYQHRTRYGFLAFVDARDPDHYFLTGTDLFMQPLLAQCKAVAIRDLMLYVNCAGADRFEAQVYSTRTPGYRLDNTLPIPIATQLDEMPMQLEGMLSGELDPAAPPIYDAPQHRAPGTLVPTHDGGLMVINPDGSVQRVLKPLPRIRSKE